MYKLIMFDFADTIACQVPTKVSILQDFIFNEIKITIDMKKIESIYHFMDNTNFYSSVEIKDQRSKKEYYDQYNEKVFRLLGLSHSIDITKYYSYFSKREKKWILKEGVYELLKELYHSKYIISLVSNFDTRLEDILDNLGVKTFFNSIVISQKENLEKPNEAFFKIALKKHGIDTQKTLFLGDSYCLDFFPTKAMGIRAILLDEGCYYPYVDSHDKIKNILELRKILVNL